MCFRRLSKSKGSLEVLISLTGMCSCWHQFNAHQVENRPLRMEDQGDDKEVQLGGV